MYPEISLFGLSVNSYGLMRMFGLLAVYFCHMHLVKKENLDKEKMLIMEFWMVIFSVTGSKILYCLVNYNGNAWNDLLSLHLMSFFSKGYVLYGAQIATVFCVFLISYLYKMDKRYAYIGLIPMPLFNAFGRIGCFLNGCCYGKAYDGPFSIVFPNGVKAPSNIPLFPSQLAEMVAALLIFIGLYKLYHSRYRKFIPEVYGFFYSIIRFILEYYRGDPERGMIGMFSTSQFISIIVFIISIISFVYRRRMQNGFQID